MLAEEKKLCGYLDMPLQHVSDKILKAMARAWGQKKTLALLDRLKERVPGLALRTTFIVGFPGETESDFQEILKTVEQGYFEHAGVFPYSLEQRSPSSRLSDAVPAAVVEERWQRLLEAQSRVMEKKALARVEKEVAILVEKGPDNEWSARAAHQAPEVDGQVLLDQYPSQPGFYRARIKGAQGIDLIGQLSSAAGAEPKARVRKGALLTSAA
jgi:ribosomal protein S12 methylthiotransferase